MTSSFPWDDPVELVSHDSSSSNSSNPLPAYDIHAITAAIDTNSEAVLLKRAEMYQDFMKQIPIPTRRGSAIPFTSWTGLGESIKKLYGQPLHYLTNVLLKEWDQLRIGSPDEYKPLDYVVHPVKAEASIWVIEEVHRQTSSHLQIAKLWKADAMHYSFIDSIVPTPEHAF